MNLWGHQFSQNANQKVSRFLYWEGWTEIWKIFGLHFRWNDDLINSFRIYLTFSVLPVYERICSKQFLILSTKTESIYFLFVEYVGSK